MAFGLEPLACFKSITEDTLSVMLRDFTSLYRAFFRTSMALMFQYRAAMFIWMIGRILEPLIYLVVWTTVAASQGGQVGSYSAQAFATYFIVLMVVNQLTFTWIMWEYEYRVRHGSLSFMLLRPVHPIHNDIADNIAYKILTSVIILPAVIVLVVLFDPELHPEFWMVVFFAFSLLLGFLLRFFVEWALAQTAFWTTRVSALNHLYFTVLIFLSGRMAPLSLFPESVQTVAKVLPFYWMIGFPSEVLLGRMSMEACATGLAVQTVWIAVSVSLLSVIWKAGVKKYSAVGA